MQMRNLKTWILALLFLAAAAGNGPVPRAWGAEAPAQRAKPRAAAPPKKAATRPEEAKPAAPAAACRPCIEAQERFLASDALRGRGSGTDDERIAAAYLGSELLRYGIEPAGDDGGYVQTATLRQPTLASPPAIAFAVNGQETRWTHGQQVLVYTLGGGRVSGPLQKITKGQKPADGAVAFLGDGAGERDAFALLDSGAAAVLVAASARTRERWQQVAGRLPQLPIEVGATQPMERVAAVALSQDAAAALQAVPDGTLITLEAKFGEPRILHTYNAVGILRGAEPDKAVLLSAHLDHLGVGQSVNGDAIYNGADDDASGCVAVLEMARVLGAGPRPRRTVVFVMFGSEERGGLGSRWWLEHPTVPLTGLVANLEFEMIGRADAAVKPGELWLTGWERSNLGPELARHGARLVGDPHPDQNFFARSDNIVLARRGVVAQTVSSFGVHSDYHRPSDDAAHLDFQHMQQAIGSLIEPVRWLVNSDFVPEWVAGKKP